MAAPPPARAPNDRIPPGRRRLASALIALSALFGQVAAKAEAENGDLALKVKASYVYNLIRFIRWPQAALDPGVFQLCVVGDDPLVGVIERLDGRTVGGRTIHVLRAPKPRQRCPLTYLARSEEQRLAALIERFAQPGILTVGDIDRFARRGGIVGFFLDGERVAIRINPATAQRRGLEISSRLLEIAELVEENESRHIRQPATATVDRPGGSG